MAIPKAGGGKGEVPRVVFDSNVLVAAYNWPGGSADRAYLLAREGLVELHVSRFILGEVERVLVEKLGWEAERASRAAAQIRRVAKGVHDPPESVREVEGDETDNRILECALTAGAEFVVTGDRKHLLPLGSFRETSIISLRDFLERTARR